MDKSQKQRPLSEVNENDESISDNVSLVSYIENFDNNADETIDELNAQFSWDTVDETTDNQERFDRVNNIILETHAGCNVLEDEQRMKLINDILNCNFNDQVLLKKSGIRDIARRICEVFEHEKMGIYFSENGSKVRGKLYFRYNNRLKKLRAERFCPPSKRSKISKTVEEDLYLISENEKISIEYLNLDTLESIATVASHWTTTFDYRQSLIKDSNRVLAEILDQWKCLKFSFSHVLICQDFKEMYGFDCAAGLRRNWNAFFDVKKVGILRTKVKDRSTIRTVKNLPSANEYLAVSIVYYLNAVLCPPLMNKNYRPTIKNAQDSVLMKGGSEEEIAEEVSKFSDAWTRGKIEPHPLIFFVESKDKLKFVLIFHRLRYEFANFFMCMDVCFKLYITLNINFPFESKQFYQFLNEVFYKIPHKETSSSKTLVLVQDLQDFQDSY